MKRKVTKLCLIFALVMMFSAIPCRAEASGGSIASLSLTQICNAVNKHYAQVNPMAPLVVFPSEAIKKDFGYILILRYRDRDTANTMYGGLYVYLDTGKAEDEYGDVWYIRLPGATSAFKAYNRADGIRLAWNKVSGATGYYIYRNKTRIATIKGGSTLTYIDKTATANGARYTYKIVARNSVGKSAKSRSVKIYRVLTPDITALKSITAGRMTVQWRRNAKASGYVIQYSRNKNFSVRKNVYVRSRNVVSKTITGLSKGKVYYVRIRTYKTVSGKKYYSGWSKVKRVVVKR